jgi:hypothetical protein
VDCSEGNNLKPGEGELLVNAIVRNIHCELIESIGRRTGG